MGKMDHDADHGPGRNRRDDGPADPLVVAMERLAAVGWRAFEPSLDPALASAFAGKAAVLDALARRIDETVRTSVDEDARDPAFPMRERLLEVLMSRFDAMRPFKPGIAAVLAGLPTDPSTAVGGLPLLRSAMRDTLAQVGGGPDGLAGELRAKGLAGVFLLGLRIWLDDDSPDLSATMRELDRRLRTAEQWAITLGLGRTPGGAGG
jgi:AcrR family transcriptional regulator